MRLTTNFNDNWVFLRDDNPIFANPQYQDSQWKKLRLPHDWSTEYAPDEKSPAGGGGAYATAGTGWYRKHWNCPDEWIGKHISLCFSGVYMDSNIYLNG